MTDLMGSTDPASSTASFVVAGVRHGAPADAPPDTPPPDVPVAGDIIPTRGNDD